VRVGGLLLACLVGCASPAKPPPKRAATKPTLTAPNEPPPRRAAAKPAPTAPTPGGKPAWAARMSSNCQAQLAFTEELTRLLAKAAAHATSSQACVDGPGVRVAVDEILVCPGRIRGDSALMYTRYRVTRTREGDTRICSGRPGGCDWTKPVRSTHYAAFIFVGKGGAYLLKVPKSVPGMTDATPLDRMHRGGCYGKSGPFVPKPVKR